MMEAVFSFMVYIGCFFFR